MLPVDDGETLDLDVPVDDLGGGEDSLGGGGVDAS